MGFSSADGEFGQFDSLQDRWILKSKEWWITYGSSIPKLQSIALKLLAQPSSSSSAEKNRSTYGFILAHPYLVLFKMPYSVPIHVPGTGYVPIPLQRRLGLTQILRWYNAYPRPNIGQPIDVPSNKLNGPDIQPQVWGCWDSILTGGMANKVFIGLA